MIYFDILYLYDKFWYVMLWHDTCMQYVILYVSYILVFYILRCYINDIIYCSMIL